MEAETVCCNEETFYLLMGENPWDKELVFLPWHGRNITDKSAMAHIPRKLAYYGPFIIQRSFAVIQPAFTPYLHQFLSQDWLMQGHGTIDFVKLFENVLYLGYCKTHRCFHFQKTHKIRGEDTLEGIVNHRRLLLSVNKKFRQPKRCREHIHASLQCPLGDIPL